jgi:hypothetical protein
MINKEISRVDYILRVTTPFLILALTSLCLYYPVRGVWGFKPTVPIVSNELAVLIASLLSLPVFLYFAQLTRLRLKTLGKTPSLALFFYYPVILLSICATATFSNSERLVSAGMGDGIFGGIQTQSVLLQLSYLQGFYVLTSLVAFAVVIYCSVVSTGGSEEGNLNRFLSENYISASVHVLCLAFLFSFFNVLLMAAMGMLFGIILIIRSEFAFQAKKNQSVD